MAKSNFKTLLYGLLVVSLAALALITILVLCMRNHDGLPERTYIAHAGGNIDGYSYTNSLEAVINAINKGATYIELDLMLTSDSVLVAAHDWRELREMTGMEPSDDPVSYVDFINARIYGRFRPLSATMIDSVFEANPHLVLVTDRTDDITLLSRWLPNTRGRMYVECFSDETYDQVKASGTATPMRSGYKSPYSMDVLGFGKFYAMDAVKYTNLRNTMQYKFLTRILGYPVAVFAVPAPDEWASAIMDKAFADSLMDNDPYLRLFYVDEL